MNATTDLISPGESPQTGYFGTETPEAFTDIAEGLKDLDAKRQQALEEFQEEVRQQMESKVSDPSQALYLLRSDRKTMVTSEEEAVECMLKGVAMKYVTYAAAMQALQDEDARKRQKTKAKQKKKSAKASRKKNR